MRGSRYEEFAVAVPVRSALSLLSPISKIAALVPSPLCRARPRGAHRANRRIAGPGSLARLAAAGLFAVLAAALSPAAAVAQPLPAPVKRPAEFPPAPLTIGMHLTST